MSGVPSLLSFVYHDQLVGDQGHAREHFEHADHVFNIASSFEGWGTTKGKFVVAENNAYQARPGF